MDSRRAKNDEQAQDRELERYREAAEGALDQLEFCVEYLHRVRKPEIAQAIARNRRQILERLR
jgi:hypothetical protein